MNRGPACRDCPASTGAWSPEECIGCNGGKSCDGKVDYGKPIFQGESERPRWSKNPKEIKPKGG